MKHYPNEIAHKTFERKMMGYDPDDVSHFLTIVARDDFSFVLSIVDNQFCFSFSIAFHFFSHLLITSLNFSSLTSRLTYAFNSN